MVDGWTCHAFVHGFGGLVYGPGPHKRGFHYQSRGKGSLCFLASLLRLEHKLM